jgi:hypothetical protein
VLRIEVFGPLLITQHYSARGKSRVPTRDGELDRDIGGRERTITSTAVATRRSLSTREGTVFYADIHFNRDDDDNGVYVARSTNGGFTWSRPCTPIPLTATDATARCGGAGDPRQPGDGTIIYTKDNNTAPDGSVPFNDKEYIGIGPRPAGVSPKCFTPVSHTPTTCAAGVVGPDRIYVTWTIFTDVDAKIYISYSDDRAHSWSNPTAISGSAAFCAFGASPNACDSNQGSQPVVNPTNGHLYVAWENFNTPDENQYLLVRSNDGGVTFAGPFFITTDFDVNYPLAGGPSATRNRPDCTARGQQAGRRVLTNSCFRVNARGAIAVDPRGGAFANDLYVVISDNRNGTKQSSNTDVFLFKSTDGGSTWVGPTRVNDDASAQPANRNCSRSGQPACPAGFNTGNDQFYPWLAMSDKGDLVAAWQDRRLDTTSTDSEWPTSRTRTGNYLLWFWGGHCSVTTPDSSECVAPTASAIPQPTAPVDPGNALFPEQSVFPFKNFGISDSPYNWDYSFRAGVFAGDYENVTIGPDNRAYALWTDARNGRSSRTEAGRNPACEPPRVRQASARALAQPTSRTHEVIVQEVPEDSNRNFVDEQERLDALRQFRPAEPRAEVAHGEDWSFMVYRTADGFGVTFARHGGGSAHAIGSGPLREGGASKYIVVMLGAPYPASDGRGVICGLVTAAVSRVEVELRDGAVASAETLPSPDALATDLRTLLIRPRFDGKPLGIGPGQPPVVRTFSCLASDGLVLERHILDRRDLSG